MSEAPEEIVLIPGPMPLHGIVHRCRGKAFPAWGLLFCDPFAEEKKCAHRVLVEAARVFCAANITCLRFDYRGTGDSPGDFADATLELWLEDILAAARYMRQALQVQTLGLLGLRLGGALACQAAFAEIDLVDFLVLWEPVIEGKQYLQQNFRRSLIKAMLTDEKQFNPERVRALHYEMEIFDFDGYPVTAEMRRQIEAIDLLGLPGNFPGPALVVQIGPRQEPAEPYQELADLLGGRAIAVRQEPFWARIGLINPRPLIEMTELWLAEQQASWAKDRLRNKEEPKASPENISSET